MLQHEIHRVPVTALAFSQDFLFAAEGPILRIHDRHDSKLFSTLKVFSSQAIHGITVYASGIIVWGGRLVATYDFCRGPNLLERRSILEAIDWILDVSVSPESHKQKAALVTAHNALLLLDLEKTTQPGTELRELTSNSKCILYSAHLHWINDQQVLVASGTVFGDIIVWSCFLGGQTKDSFSTLHHVLMGHDGSIFGVQVFERPTVEGDESPSRLLATCSDDRTVRIWDISLLPDTATNPQAAADLTSTRETGFGINIADMLPDNPSGGRCIAKAWGHASRIWGVKFIPAATDVISYVVSFGEDATCQYWALTSLGIQQYSLSHLATSGSHSGKNIWSWAITRNAEHDFVIASGGADGSISLEPRTIPIVGASSRIQTWSIDDLASSCSQGSNSGRKDKLRSYAFLDHKDLLITTDAGNVLRLTQKERDHSKIELISTEPVLKGYSVVTSIPSLAIAFMSGMDGSVLMYDGTTVSQIVKSSGKSAGLFAQHFTAQAGHSRLGLLVTNVEAKTALFTCSDLTNDIDTALPLSNMFQWQLRLPKSFIITSSFAVPLDGSAHKIMLILGSRNGSIVSFLLDREGPQDTPIETALDGLIQNAHGTDAVTDLAWVAGTDAASDDGYLFSVGRDRAYTVHHLSRSEPAVKFRLVNRTYLSMGNNIEGLYVDKATGHVLVWGFHSKQFIVFDVTDETEIMTVDCGGANRSWVFEPGKGLQGGQFAWTKVSQLCLFSQRQRPRQALDKGGHGREIKAVAVSPNNPAGDGTLFATGAEDTDIKLFAYHRENKAPNFHCVRTLRKHNTGIQQLEWSSDGHYLFSSGGFEEFFVWKVEAAPLVGLGVACVSVCPTESAIPDLRIMGFSVSHDMYGFVITMARSDSTLRMYRYNPDHDNEWHILMAGNYLTSCLTQCLHVRYTNVSETLITAGTDGHIAFYPLENTARRATPLPATPDELRWVARAKVHQNTIHCMKIHWLSEVTCLVLTGGDDNGLALTLCTWHDTDGRPKSSTLVVPRAHTAAMTGIEIIASSSPDTIIVATTSIDQRIKLWEVHSNLQLLGTDGLTVRRRDNHFTAVADVSSLASLDSTSIIICGVGMDVWRVETQ